jgi:hypothetical protein
MERRKAKNKYLSRNYHLPKEPEIAHAILIGNEDLQFFPANEAITLIHGEDKKISYERNVQHIKSYPLYDVVIIEPQEMPKNNITKS